jgi:hypothetical protein
MVMLSAWYLVLTGFLLGFFFDLEGEGGGGYGPAKHWLTFNRLHLIISQEIELFITTAVRSSDPT